MAQSMSPKEVAILGHFAYRDLVGPFGQYIIDVAFSDQILHPPCSCKLSLTNIPEIDH